MITKNELLERTKRFSHRCVKLALSLPNNKLGNHLQGQLIRSSTAVPANYRAACIAQTKKSFVAKLSIVIEECDESYFWLQFILDEKLISGNEIMELIQEAKELTSIFISSRKTATLNNK
ncbi:MAG: four helix bundle protein [Bacteroidales bacterium]